MSQNGHVLGHDYEFALNFSSGSADLLVVVCISHKVAKPDGTFRWLVPCPELGHTTGVRALLVAAGEQEDIRPFFA
jgi:hypothetical protein